MKIVKQFSDDIGNNGIWSREACHSQHDKMKKKIRKEYNRRGRLILINELNGRNKN